MQKASMSKLSASSPAPASRVRRVASVASAVSGVTSLGGLTSAVHYAPESATLTVAAPVIFPASSGAAQAGPASSVKVPAALRARFGEVVALRGLNDGSMAWLRLQAPAAAAELAAISAQRRDFAFSQMRCPLRVGAADPRGQIAVYAAAPYLFLVLVLVAWGGVHALAAAGEAGEQEGEAAAESESAMRSLAAKLRVMLPLSGEKVVEVAAAGAAAAAGGDGENAVAAATAAGVEDGDGKKAPAGDGISDVSTAADTAAAGMPPPAASPAGSRDATAHSPGAELALASPRDAEEHAARLVCKPPKPPR